MISLIYVRYQNLFWLNWYLNSLPVRDRARAHPYYNNACVPFAGFAAAERV